MLWKHKGVRDEVKILPTEALLHFLHIDCQSIFPSELATRREVVYLLILIEPLEEVIFALSVRPEHIPVVAIRRDQTIDLE